VQAAHGRFGADLTSVSASREFTRRALTGEAPDAAVDAAVLVVSELATNALLHAASAFEVSVEADVMLRVAVTDDSRDLPVVNRGVSRHAASGRGMWMVEQMCERWGIDPAADGKRVWAELSPAAVVGAAC